MKKNFMLTFSLAAVMTASAVNLQLTENALTRVSIAPKSEIATTKSVTAELAAESKISYAASRAEQTSIEFSYCLKEPESGLGLSNQEVGNIVRQGIEIPASTATLFAGAQITSVNICSGFDEDLKKNLVTNIKLFLTNDLAGEPFYTQDATLGSEAAKWNKITLTKPYTIEAGKPIFIGYEFTMAQEHLKGCYFFVLDGRKTSNPEGSWTYFKEDGEYIIANFSSQNGNLLITADIQGKLPTNSGTVKNLQLPLSSISGQSFPFSFELKNVGIDDINNGEIEISVNGGAPTPFPFDFSDRPIKFTEGGILSGNFMVEEVGSNVNVKITLAKINNKPNNVTDNSKVSENTFRVFAEGDGFDRTVVLEEGTGTWCQYCPAGIVLLDHARKDYTDGSLIGIAVHSGGGDPMTAKSYQPFIDKYIYDFPQVMANRLYYGTIEPNAPHNDKALRQLYDNLRSQPASAKISLKAEFDESKKNILCYSETQTCENLSGTPYRIAYVLIEDKVGPFNQNNFYSGTGLDIDGWETYGKTKQWIYDDVARNITTWDGAAESLPATLNAGQTYTHRESFKFPRTSKSANCRVIAMLISTKDGHIENACEATIDAAGAVESIIGDNEAIAINGVTGAIAIEGNYKEAIVYNFDGTIAAMAAGDSMIAMPAGMYIVKVDNIVKKVVVL